MAKRLIPFSDYTVDTALNTVVIKGNIQKEKLLLITDITSGKTIYQFNDPNLGATLVYDKQQEETVLTPTYDMTNDALVLDTNNFQIFVDHQATEFEPTKSLLDAVGKLRVSMPENLIDTDFEYGLQSSKWETIQSVNNIPSVYSYTGDLPVEGLVSVDALSGSKQVKVTTNIPHGLSLGDPISVQGVTLFQSEGYFIISGVPDALTFFYELDVEANDTGDISGSYTTIIPAKFYQGSALLLNDEFGAQTNGQDPSTISVTTDQTHGFAEGTKVYLRNTVGPKELVITDPTATAADDRPTVDTESFFQTTTTVDALASTGRGSYKEPVIVTYDWQPVYHKYLSPSDIDTVTDQITWPAHGFNDRYCLLFSTPVRGDSDGGMSDGSVYYVHVIDDDTITLSSNYETPTSNVVSLSPLLNTYGAARLGLVYKVEASSGTTRTTAYRQRAQASYSSSYYLGYVNTSGSYYNISLGNVSNYGGDVNNINSVYITRVYGTGDLNYGSEYVNFYRVGQNFKGLGTGFNYMGRYYRNNNYFNWDMTSSVFQSGSTVYLRMYIGESSATAYHYPTYYYTVNYASAGGTDHSGSDLLSSEFGLGQSAGQALVAFQGRTPGSYSSSADAYSYLTNQRTNGRYTNTRIQYPGTTVSSAPLNGDFVTTYNDSGTTNYGNGSEIFYAFAQTLDTEANTFYIQDHGVKEGDTVVVNIAATNYNNGERFVYSDSLGAETTLNQQNFETTASVINKDVFKLTLNEAPNTDDILNFAQNFELSIRTDNELYNTIYVPNHKITSLTNATYLTPGYWNGGPFYVNGTSGGVTGYYYPLYLSQTDANAADTTTGTSHLHNFDEYPSTSFYMPDDDINHGMVNAPTDIPEFVGSYNRYSITADTGTTNFVFNGQDLPTNSAEPEIILYRGSTYYFDCSTGAQPFYIKTAISAGTADQQTTGVTNNGSTSGIVTFSVPQNAPDTLYYCGSDIAYSGTFNVQNATAPIGGLTNNFSYTLERVNDSRLRIANLVTSSNTATTDIGESNNNTISYDIDVETILGITDPSTATITKIEYRGDFGSERNREEYVTLTFPDGDNFLIGATGGADTDQWLTESSFSSKDVSALLEPKTSLGGNIGFTVTADPTSDVNFGQYLPNGDYWQIRFSISGQAGGIVLENTAAGLQTFSVPSVVGSYDGIYTINSVTGSNSFNIDSSFQVPERTYPFNVSAVDTLDYSIDLGVQHNLRTGEKITYGNKGNPNIMSDDVVDDLHVIAVDGTKIKLASSKISAENNSAITLSQTSGQHEFRSSNVIKNVNGSGFVSGTSGAYELTGTGTNFLTSFKTFDKIYVTVDGFVQAFTVDKITTDSNMTLFDPLPANFTDVNYYYSSELNLRPDGFSLHLPFDGGVNITAGTSPGSKIVRQSRKYFRYQSGKGIQNSFAINFNPPRVVKEVIRADGAIASVKTQEVHNLKVGDPIEVQDAEVSIGENTYNGRFTVSTVVDPFEFEYVMDGTPEQLKAEGYPKYLRQTWNDSYIRAGMYDDQNGFFMEYDGSNLYMVRRSSTLQLSGVVAVNRSSQIVTGTGTSFTTQLKAGDNVVLRGQSYRITQVASDNRIIVQPAYRGVSAKNVKLTKTVDTRTPQTEWNIDKCDGTGRSGFVLDLTKIQMAYADYSWYGAGKIRYGFKDQNGEVVYVHEYKHNNRLGESYFRSGNLPGRYEIENGPQANAAPTLFHFGTSIIMDGTFDDDKAYLFTGNSAPFAYTNGTSDTFTQAASNSTFEVITLDGKRVFVYAIPCAESDLAKVATGIQIQDSGNNFLPEGTYVTQVKKDGANSVVYTSYPALQTQPSGTTYPDIPASTTIQTGEVTAVDLTQPLPLVSIRLAPSVDSSLTGAVGEREIINRMQMALKEAGVTTNQDVEIFLILNALPNRLVFSKVDSPSLSEIIKHKAGDTLLGGTTVYSLKQSAGSISIDLNNLIELGNSILGGDGVFPAGPDFLTLAVQPQDTTNTNGANPFFVSGKLSWSESQA